jgi:hypothetical protein
MYLDTLGSVKELIICHPKLSSKVSPGYTRLEQKYLSISLLCPSTPILWILSHWNTEPPCSGILFLCNVKIMQCPHPPSYRIPHCRRNHQTNLFTTHWLFCYKLLLHHNIKFQKQKSRETKKLPLTLFFLNTLCRYSAGCLLGPGRPLCLQEWTAPSVVGCLSGP